MEDDGNNRLQEKEPLKSRDPLVCIMVLHQARLEIMFKNFTNYKSVYQEKIRVLNGAILKFHINAGQSEGTVDLIYKGCTTCDTKNEKYFTTDTAYEVPNGPTYVQFVQLQYFLKTPATQTVTTYGVRHGESLHNLKQYQTKAKLFSRKLSGSFKRAINPLKFTNTSLTTDDGTEDKGEGVQSIKDAGTKLYQILQIYNITQIDYLCSSYLYRAMQTAAIIYEQLTAQPNPIEFKRNKQIQIFPCINEKGSGWENVSFTRQTNVNGVSIDWTFYGTMGKNWFGATQLYKFGANSTRKLWGNKNSRKVTICPGPIELVIEADDFYEKSKVNNMSTAQLVDIFSENPDNNQVDDIPKPDNSSQMQSINISKFGQQPDKQEWRKKLRPVSRKTDPTSDENEAEKYNDLIKLDKSEKELKSIRSRQLLELETRWGNQIAVAPDATTVDNFDKFTKSKGFNGGKKSKGKRYKTRKTKY